MGERGVIRRRQTQFVSDGSPGGAGRFPLAENIPYASERPGAQRPVNECPFVKMPSAFSRDRQVYSPVIPALSMDSTNCFCRKKYSTIIGAMASMVPAILMASFSLLVEVVDWAWVA